MNKQLRDGLSYAVLVIAALALTIAAGASTPQGLRRANDTGAVPFHIGTAVTLHGGPSLYPPNGYQPGLLTHSHRDKVYQTLVRTQFNQIEPGNAFKMMSLWTGGVKETGGRYSAVTNLYDPTGPMMLTCHWAETQKHPLWVRGHCMVYNQDYTLPHFPGAEPQLFISSQGVMVRNPLYTADDLREMLHSYVNQVVDATLVQNAISLTKYHYKVIPFWDVTNEVVSENSSAAIPAQLGFAYKSKDPWYRSGPVTPGLAGYDYVGDIYRWAANEMKDDIGQTIHGHRISAKDRFELYYNEYNLEWSGVKMAHVLALVQHVRASKGEVDGIGFQAHIMANGLDVTQFAANIRSAIKDHLRFSLTENDCAISENPMAGQPTVAQQEVNQGNEYGEVVGLCVRFASSCDCYQIWGATDDGSWLQNAEATPFTRWVVDTRPGPTHGKLGYWPKAGQYDPETEYDVATHALDPKSGHNVSDAYTQMRQALKQRH